MVKNPPANAGDIKDAGSMRVQSLGWEDPLEDGMATHPSIPAWRIPWTEEATVHGVTRSWTRLKRLSTHGCTSTCSCA